MAYANAFSLGPCSVTVLNRLFSPILSQEMAIGQTVDVLDPATSNTLTVTVNGDGSVQITSLYDLLPGATYTLIVQPLYAITADAPMQIADMAVSPNTFSAFVFADPDPNGEVKNLDSVNPPSPDPILISDITGPHTVLGMQVGNLDS